MTAIFATFELPIRPTGIWSESTIAVSTGRYPA